MLFDAKTAQIPGAVTAAGNDSDVKHNQTTPPGGSVIVEIAADPHVAATSSGGGSDQYDAHPAFMSLMLHVKWPLLLAGVLPGAACSWLYRVYQGLLAAGYIYGILGSIVTAIDGSVSGGLSILASSAACLGWFLLIAKLGVLISSVSASITRISQHPVSLKTIVAVQRKAGRLACGCAFVSFALIYANNNTSPTPATLALLPADWNGGFVVMSTLALVFVSCEALQLDLQLFMTELCDNVASNSEYLATKANMQKTVKRFLTVHRAWQDTCQAWSLGLSLFLLTALAIMVSTLFIFLVRFHSLVQFDINYLAVNFIFAAVALLFIVLYLSQLSTR